MKIKINEIFNSLQGECDGFGEQGLPTTFIRLQGCNLKCNGCDTPYALSPGGGTEMTADEIVSRVERSKVTITGGEPLLQLAKVKELVGMLHAKGKKVTVETNGSVHIPPDFYFPPFSTVNGENLRLVVDYKPPSSGMEKRMREEVFTKLSSLNIIKFVVADEKDYSRMKHLVTTKCNPLESDSLRWKAKIAVSPRLDGEREWPEILARMLAEDKDLENVQYSIQLHKIIGVR